MKLNASQKFLRTGSKINPASGKVQGLLLASLLLISVEGYAQSGPDSVRTSAASVKSPAGAMIRSALVPGLGQLYNRQWLKSLLVAGIEAGLAGNAALMNRRMLDSQSADEYDFYEHNRGTFIWWLVGVHLLSILDAYVDAQLFDFDIDPDLTPAGPGSGQSAVTAGIGLTFRF